MRLWVQSWVLRSRGRVIEGQAMGFNAARLTCFALISSMEEDCRAEIRNRDDLVLPQAVTDKAAERLARDGAHWNGVDKSPLIDYLDFADAYELLGGRKAGKTDRVGAAMAAVRERLDDLASIRNRVAHTRPMEIDDFATLHDISRTLVATAPGAFSGVAETSPGS